MLEYFVQRRSVNLLKSGEKQVRFVAKLNEKPLYTVKEICKDVALNCTLSEAETELAVKEIENAILKQIANGRSIQLGSLGSLHPNINAQSEDSEDKVTVKTIKKVSCYFLPTRSFSKFLNNIPLHRTEKQKNLVD